MDRRKCPDCDRPLTRQQQKSGAIQWICRKGKHRSGCGWNMTEGGRLPGGKVKGAKPMTGAERIRNFREKEKAMSDIDTREVGQVVWLETGNIARTIYHKLTIEKVLKQYVECSDGQKYNLAPGMKHGDRRGHDSGVWSRTPSITTIDRTAECEAQQKEDLRKEMAVAVQSVVAKLGIDKLDRILAIINEGCGDDTK